MVTYCRRSLGHAVGDVTESWPSLNPILRGCSPLPLSPCGWRIVEGRIQAFSRDERKAVVDDVVAFFVGGHAKW